MKLPLGILAFSLRSLQLRTARHLASGVALFVLAALFCSILFVSDALRSAYLHAAEQMPDLLVTPLHAGRPTTFPCTDAARAERIEGVASVRTRVWGYVPLEGAAANMIAIGIDPQQAARANNLAPLPSNGGWMLLGEALATALGVHSNDALTFPLEQNSFLELRIRSVLPARTLPTAGDAAFMTENDARALLHLAPNECTDLLVALHDPAEATVAARKLLRAFPQARILERSSLLRAFELTFATRGGLLFFLFLPTLLGIVLFAWDRSRSSRTEEQREAAVLRTVGWSASDVLFARSIEYGIAAVLPVLLAAVVAYAFVFLFGAPGLLRALAGWSLLPSLFPLVPSTEIASLVAVLSLCAGPIWLASLVPTWRATLSDPYEALS